MISKIRKAFSNAFRMQSIIENKLVLSTLKQSALLSSSAKVGVENELISDKPIVVSLTTYGKKIHEVYLVIESIFQQTVRPNKVILWLSDKHFSLDNIPVVLRRQMERGLEIRFCNDVRSYTKVIYAFEEFPNAHVISVDDDIVYPFDMIESFLCAYKNNPNRIYFNRGHRMLFDKKNQKMFPYLDWCKAGYAKDSSILNLPLGVYGIFYPASIINKEVLNKSVFLDICPMADDVWFKAMSLINGVECSAVSDGAVNMNDFISIELDREKALARTNVDLGANDWQIQKVFERYNLFEVIRNETNS